MRIEQLLHFLRVLGTETFHLKNTKKDAVQGEVDIISYSCNFGDCKKFELTPVTCPYCSKTFCLAHRHQVDHACVAHVAPKNPMAEADAKIKELLNRSEESQPPKTNKRIKNDKLAAKVQLMKVKGKAEGCRSLPADERVYFLVSSKSFSGKRESVPVFVSRLWSVGKCLDAIADLAKVTNKNNDVKAARLELFRTSDGEMLRPLDAPIGELIEKGELFNGQTLNLDYLT